MHSLISTDGEYSGTTASGGAPSQLTSTYIPFLLNSGKLQSHIYHTLQHSYSGRYRLMMKAIRTHLLPLGFTLPQPDRDVVGGYFVWLALPTPLIADALAIKCAEEGVIVAPGGLFEVPGDEDAAKFDGHIRLCFAWERYSAEDDAKNSLEEGVRRVAAAARKMLCESNSSEYVFVERDGKSSSQSVALDAFK